MSRVQEINEDAQFPPAMQAAGDALVVIDCFATWCGPCQRIGPAVARLSTKYPSAVFLKVDVDRCRTVAGGLGIRSMPTFVFFRSNQKLHQFSGADEAQLEATIVRLLAEGGAAAEGGDAGDGCGVPNMRTLNEFVNKGQVECLNQSDQHTVNNIFSDSEHYLESDCDEQLLISIGFNQALKVHSLQFAAPDDGRGPLTVKLFVNQDALDFEDAESLEGAQTLTLSPADIKDEGKPIALRFVKFQTVNRLTIFLSDNQGGEDTTVLRSLKIIGQTRESTNMADFKRVAGKAGESDH